MKTAFSIFIRAQAWRSALATVCCAAVTAAAICGRASDAPTQAQVRALKNHHADLNSAISSRDVSQMQLGWKMETKENISHTPLVDGNRLYIADWGGKVYAMDTQTGDILWNSAVEQLKTDWQEYLWHNLKAQPAVLTSAGFLANDVYFVGSLDGKVRAYRANDGERLWTSPVTKPIASSLVVAGNMLYFGTGVPHHFGGKKGGGGGLYAFSAAAQPLARERQRGQEARGATGAGNGTDRGQASSQPVDGREITIIARNFEFEPSRLEVIPGQELRITLTNASNRPHSIEFELPSGEVELRSPVEPGETASLTVPAPEQAGTYIFYCPVGNHRERGMEGELIVHEHARQEINESSLPAIQPSSQPARPQSRSALSSPLFRRVQAQSPDQEPDAGPPEMLYGTWVAQNVQTDQGEVKIKLVFYEEGPVRVLAWSELFFVGQVRNIKAPYRVEGNTIISDAIRGGTRVQYWFDEGDLIIEYEDGQTVRFHRPKQ